MSKSWMGLGSLLILFVFAFGACGSGAAIVDGSSLPDGSQESMAPVDGPDEGGVDGDANDDQQAPDMPMDVAENSDLNLEDVLDATIETTDARDVSEHDVTDVTQIADVVDGDSNPDAPMPPDAVVDAAPEAVDPPWSPRNLEGLVLWLDASQGATADKDHRLDLWRDLSRNDNHARQAVNDLKPRLLPASIAGHASVSFRPGPTLLVVPDSNSLRWGTGDYAAWAVVRCTTQEGLEAVFYKVTATEPWPGPQLWMSGPRGDLYSSAGAQTFRSPAGGFNDNLAHLVGVQRAGGVLTMRADGIEVGRLAAPDTTDVSAPTQNLYFGSHFLTQGFRFQGEIGEFVAVKGALSERERANLEQYLMQRYEIPPSAPP